MTGRPKRSAVAMQTMSSSRSALVDDVGVALSQTPLEKLEAYNMHAQRCDPELVRSA